MDKFYTIPQVATLLHRSDQTVSRWVKEGKLPFVQLSPRARLISETAINEFLAQRVVLPPKKRVDSGVNNTPKIPDRSLTTETTDVKTLRKEISQLCR